jgi:serine/threonine-protein kinase
MQRDQVEAYLNEHGYELGSVKNETSPEPEGLVLSQDPVGGTSADKESKVNIIVSDGKGKEMSTVPSVTKLSLADAEKEIKAAGFTPGEYTYSYDDNIGKGYVIYQQWQAGMQLEKGSTIDLEISKGPEPAPEPKEENKDNKDNTDNTNTDKDKEKEDEKQEE